MWLLSGPEDVKFARVFLFLPLVNMLGEKEAGRGNSWRSLNPLTTHMKSIQLILAGNVYIVLNCFYCFFSQMHINMNNLLHSTQTLIGFHASQII